MQLDAALLTPEHHDFDGLRRRSDLMPDSR